LLELLFPSRLERFYPKTIFLLARHVDDDSREIVAVNDSSLFSAPFDDLRFITGGAEAIADFQHGQRKPRRGDIATIIELSRQHHLETLPLRV